MAKYGVILTMVLVFVWGCSSLQGPVENPVPALIRDIPMGASQAQVMDKIKGVGTTTLDTSSRRPKLKWKIPGNPDFHEIEFDFTEKDHLFIIRFAVTDRRRDVYDRLKKAFFSTFNFSWDEPLRTRVKDSDVLFYAPEKGAVFFLEFTDKKSGDKTIELFERRISGLDREAYAAEMKAAQAAQEAQKTPTDAGEAPAEPSPESKSAGTTSPPEAAPATPEPRQDTAPAASEAAPKSKPAEAPAPTAPQVTEPSPEASPEPNVSTK